MASLAGTTEMDATAAGVAQRPHEAIGVGPGKGQPVATDRPLGGADVGRRFVSGNVVAGPRHEPGDVALHLPVRRADQPAEVLRVQRARQRPGGVGLIGVALPLVPEHRPEAGRPDLRHAAKEHGECRAVTLEAAAGRGAHPGGDRRRGRKPATGRQPLADARRPDPTGDKPDRHVEPRGEQVTERRQEAPAIAAGPRLRVGSGAPTPVRSE